MTMQTVSFRTSSSKVAALDALASTERRDRTFLLNEAIDHYLAMQEKRDSLIREGLAAIEAGRTVPHADVRAWAQSLKTTKPLPRPAVKASRKRT